METDPAVWLDVLAGSHDRICELAADLDAPLLRSPSYCTGWSIAKVLSHLGSGAEIFGTSLDAALAGVDPPDPSTFPAVWDRWDALRAEEQRDEFLAADGRLVERLEELGDALDGLHVAPFGVDMDAVGFLGARLSEHAVHTWDVAVALEPEARVDRDAVSLLVDRLPELAPHAADAEDAGAQGSFSLTVETSDPERRFLVRVDDAVELDALCGAARGPGAEIGATLRVDAEVFLRLVYGRLDPAHGPALGAGQQELVDRLRTVFRGF